MPQLTQGYAQRDTLLLVCHCANIIKYTYINMHGITYYLPRQCGKVRCLHMHDEFFLKCEMTSCAGESDAIKRHNKHEAAKTEASIAWHSISAYSNF